MQISLLLPLILFTACATAPHVTSVSDDVAREPTSEEVKPPCASCLVPTTEERLKEIARARTLLPAGSEKLDRSIFDGPGQSEFVPKWNEVIRCKFIEPTPGHPMGGATPKLNCQAMINGKAAILRVKYQNPEILPSGRSSEENEGVFGDLLGSRLAWRMGFYAHEIYPVRLICENCPVRPWEYIEAVTEPADDLTTAELAERLHPVRLTELHLPIAEIAVRPDIPLIETFRDQGWGWDEFAKLRPQTRELRAEHDALALLAAFLQHADNKPEQQELRCASAVAGTKDVVCAQPVIAIGDVGMTFGNGFKSVPLDLPKKEIRRLRNISIDESAASLKGFSEAPVWSDVRECITNVRYKESTGVPANQRISEAGRTLFLERIGRLSDQDIIDLFSAVRIELRGEKIVENGHARAVTAQDWLPVFKARIAKFRQVVCPSI